MLNQLVSIDDEGRPATTSTALIPLSAPSAGQHADPELHARVAQAAAASGASLPILIPGAAALVFPVHLPMKSPRQRRKALPFAAEPYLAEPLEDVVLALGPQITDTTWICVAVSRDLLDQIASASSDEVPLFPELLAVPLPSRTGAWAIWSGAEQVHVRLDDGSGVSVARDDFNELWQAYGRPPLEIFHGNPPGGVVGQATAPDELDPDLLSIDLKTKRSGRLSNARGSVRFSFIVSVIAGLLHIGLVHGDAQMLTRLADERAADAQTRLDAFGIDVPAEAPLRLIEAALTRRSGPDDDPPAFLRKLAKTIGAFPTNGAIAFRDLRYDATSDTLTFLLEASDLQSLQAVETTLQNAGLQATAGAATRGQAGAEMQIVVSGDL